jgi:hypothetical protein
MHPILRNYCARGFGLSRQILNGWKEISNHIERGVRTAQRWEALLGMPVHRPALKDRSAVVAFSDELDGWISRMSDGENHEMLARVKNNVNRLAWHTSEVASQTRALQKQVRRSLEAARRQGTASAHAPVRPPPRRGAMLPFRS